MCSAREGTQRAAAHQLCSKLRRHAHMHSAPGLCCTQDSSTPGHGKASIWTVWAEIQVCDVTPDHLIYLQPHRSHTA